MPLGEGVGVLATLGAYPPAARAAIEGPLGLGAVRRLAEDDRAQRLLGVAKGDEVSVRSRRGAAARRGAQAERAALEVGRVKRGLIFHRASPPPRSPIRLGLGHVTRRT